MKEDDRTKDAVAVAWEIFGYFEVVGDETVYDIDRAIDLIEAYAATGSGSESPRTTKLYDRTDDQITLDEVEKIGI
jgi:hypothetical protein